MGTLICRGKRKELLVSGNDWVYGYLVKTNKGDTLITNGEGRDDLGMISNLISVVPESVSPYIGLKTKGREVYDGDVFFDEVEHDEGDRRIYFVVKWLQQRCSFVFMDFGDTITDWDNFEENIWNDYPHVVTQEALDGMHYAGNYFDNPELLTKGDGEEE